MHIELSKFEEINYGWDIEFHVILSPEELNKCNIDPLEYVGDYKIVLTNHCLSFKFIFDKGELNENENINERLELIKLDIENLTSSCIK